MGVGGGSTVLHGILDRRAHRPFKAAVASSSYDALQRWGSGDFTWMLWNWVPGKPRSARLYLERSPVTYADNVKPLSS